MNKKINQKSLIKLEQELKEMKDYHKSLWETYGSELCSNDMLAKEQALEKQINKLK
jgi:hypothetical protein